MSCKRDSTTYSLKLCIPITILQRVSKGDLFSPPFRRSLNAPLPDARRRGEKRGRKNPGRHSASMVSELTRKKRHLTGPSRLVSLRFRSFVISIRVFGARCTSDSSKKRDTLSGKNARSRPMSIARIPQTPSGDRGV